METLCIILGCLCVAAGLIGCVIPVIPGPLLAYCGFFPLLVINKGPSTFIWWMASILLVSAAVLDSVIPALGAKKFKASKYGMAGCFIGTLAGAFFFPLGLVLGPFLGAFAGEMLKGRKIHEAINGGTGALLGFLAGTFYKLFVASLFAYWFIKAAAV